MFCFLMLIAVAVEITGGIPYAVTISTKGIQAIGKPAKNAVMTLKPRCMYTMARMNTTSSNLRIRQNSGRLVAQNVRRSSTWAMTNTLCTWGSIFAWTVPA